MNTVTDLREKSRTSLILKVISKTIPKSKIELESSWKIISKLRNSPAPLKSFRIFYSLNEIDIVGK